MTLIRPLRKWNVLLVILIILLAFTTLFRYSPFHWKEENKVQVQSNDAKRKVIILLIDSLLAEPMEHLLLTGELPAIAFLMQHGHYQREMISSFPTMSVTIDSTLITGAYADKHKIPGLLWFDAKEQRMVDYGDGLRVVWKPGMVQWFWNSFYQLNQVHLSKDTATIHEELSAKGFTSGSINGLLYRGNKTHHFGMKGISNVTVKGPDVLALGALARVTSDKLPTSPVQSLGMNNNYSIQSVISLIKQRQLPDLTLAYFPDMDSKLHKEGPSHLEGIKQVDKQLQQLLNSFGKWENALNEHVIILMGDSGVTATVRRDEKPLIDVEYLLSGFSCFRMGEKRRDSHDIAIAVNGRMAYVYSLSSRAPVPILVDRLNRDDRIDHIAWRENEWIHVIQGTRHMMFRRGSEFMDHYGKRWDIRGDADCLGLIIHSRERRVSFTDNPDALSRLESVFYSHEGEFLIVSAKPGMEIAADGAPNHPGGGNHGSLHATDSLLPFLIAPKETTPAPPERVVDVKNFLLSLLGIEKSIKKE